MPVPFTTSEVIIPLKASANFLSVVDFAISVRLVIVIRSSLL